MKYTTFFKRQSTSLAVMLALSSSAALQVAHAGAGWGDSMNATGTPIKVPTYYANSPSGLFPSDTSSTGNADCFTTTPPAVGAFNSSTVTQPGAAISVAGGLCDSGTPLRKFVDAVPTLAAATPDTTTYPGSDYYEIAVVEYTQRMHSDLAKATTLRGYVQVVSNASDASKGIAASGQTYTVPQNLAGTQSITVTAVGKPSYLGPVINATHGRPVRIKFYNLLPAGKAGDIHLPVDETITGAGLGPDGVTKYGKNRAEIHLHGGDNPWISDGTPHQWILPAADELLLSSNANAETKSMARGIGAKNVPDMPNPGPGAMTYYYPNGMSGRLMFYHDHSLGLTRLNVYAGIAAGYMISEDPTKPIGENFPGLNLPTDQKVLVIQDKTFVPKNIAMQDAKWNTAIASEGDLWYPHVYETNQDPNSFDGTNGPGRWDWGSWFWPVFASTYDLPTGEMKTATTHAPTASATSLSNVSTTPEGYMDTPVVNGMAYPTMTVDPKPYRFRILNAANDRFMNLGLYLAADKKTTDPVNPLDPTKAPKLCDGVNTIPVTDCTEVKMVNFDASYVVPPVPYTADGYQGFPTTGGITGSGWGMQVGGMFPQGAPDPATAGPHIVQIGNEAGLLAAPLDIPSTPLNYEYNKRSVTVLNVQERGLYMGPAERVDTVIDFSKYAGQTLILYNDAPAPNPASDPRIDYFTGEGDQTGVGGSPNTLPGYGPNTRTVMQIVVSGTASSTQKSYVDPTVPSTIVSNLQTYLPQAYATVQAMPVVPEPEFNAAFPSIATPTAARNNQHIWSGTVYLSKYAGVTFTAPEAITYFPAPTATNYPTAPTYACSTTATCATAVALQQATPKAPTTTPASTVATQGNGLVTSPAGATVTAYVQSKAIQELFDPAYGRMNATLGVELPFTSALSQTTIPLSYVDPLTETVADGETQFWKITHNGVDAHPVHFHLVNVQVLNRIGWDGTIKPPLGDEFGWKETVKMNPLEDIVVAVRAKKPTLTGVANTNVNPAFGLPTSTRRMDPSQPINANVGFTQVDPTTGSPATVTNQNADYGWEYVWHCHILGHEENDFMRPVKFNVLEAKPAAPTALTATASGTGVQLNWTDNATTEYAYKVERRVGTTGTWIDLTATAQQVIGTAPLANAKTFTDTSTLTAGTTYSYQVTAIGAGGNSAVATATYTTPATPAGPSTAPTVSIQRTSVTSATLTWTYTGTVSSAKVVLNGTTTGVTGAVIANNKLSATIPVTNATNASYQVIITPTTGAAVTSAAVSLNDTVAPAVPTNLTATATQTTVLGFKINTVNLVWTDVANNNASYNIRRATNAGFTTGVNNSTAAGNATTASQPGLASNTTYYYEVQAVNSVGTSPWVTVSVTTKP